MRTVDGTRPAADRSRETSHGPILDIHDLTIDYATPRGAARAVDHISFSINRGEVFGLAGESGCGKSTVAHAIMRLIKPPGEITSGRIVFCGRDLLTLSGRQMQELRWREISIVFQSAMNSLNPVISLGAQLRDAIRAHQKMSRGQAQERAAELFELVGLNPDRLSSFSHQLSGGMRQRAVIAMALALKPALIVMDEPTTALDVVVQRDILQQIEDLQKTFGFSILFITHDLSLLVEFSTRIAVMYAAKIVELAPASRLYERPMHPYTVGLMSSFPSVKGEPRQLQGIPGTPPDLVSPPSGCRFHPRCPHCRMENAELYRAQTEVEPVLHELEPEHYVACHLY